jgi:hypothetical protein
MTPLVTQLLSQSASDFVNIVWPVVKELPLIGGGQLQPVEASSDAEFAKTLDMLAGIDAWQVLTSPAAMRGLASRVQWGQAHNSFTVRIALPSGAETEYHKRIRALDQPDQGFLYPHLTVQAYLDQQGGALLSAAVVRTADLFEKARLLVQNRSKLRLDERSKLFGFRQNLDGTEFLYMSWSYLRYEGVLAAENVWVGAEVPTPCAASGCQRA